jgi:hypothetical protein
MFFVLCFVFLFVFFCVGFAFWVDVFGFI